MNKSSDEIANSTSQEIQQQSVPEQPNQTTEPVQEPIQKPIQKKKTLVKKKSPLKKKLPAKKSTVIKTIGDSPPARKTKKAIVEETLVAKTMEDQILEYIEASEGNQYYGIGYKNRTEYDEAKKEIVAYAKYIADSLTTLKTLNTRLVKLGEKMIAGKNEIDKMEFNSHSHMTKKYEERNSPSNQIVHSEKETGKRGRKPKDPNAPPKIRKRATPLVKKTTPGLPRKIRKKKAVVDQ